MITFIIYQTTERHVFQFNVSVGETQTIGAAPSLRRQVARLTLREGEGERCAGVNGSPDRAGVRAAWIIDEKACIKYKVEPRAGEPERGASTGLRGAGRRPRGTPRKMRGHQRSAPDPRLHRGWRRFPRPPRKGDRARSETTLPTSPHSEENSHHQPEPPSHPRICQSTPTTLSAAPPRPGRRPRPLLRSPSRPGVLRPHRGAPDALPPPLSLPPSPSPTRGAARRSSAHPAWLFRAARRRCAALRCVAPPGRPGERRARRPMPGPRSAIHRPRRRRPMRCGGRGGLAPLTPSLWAYWELYQEFQFRERERRRESVWGREAGREEGKRRRFLPSLEQ